MAVVELASRRCRTETKDDDNGNDGEKAPAVQNRNQDNSRKVAVACIRSRNIVLCVLPNRKLFVPWLVKVLVFYNCNCTLE
jgi:hypothetical protein